MTSIEWTDATWNPVAGCAKISAGCKHCYAETMAARHVLMSAAQGRTSPYLPVVDAERRRWRGNFITMPERLADPLGWKKPRRVFVNSMSDLFGEGVPFEFIAAVFGVMAATPRHTYQVLTKRPARMLEFFAWERQQRYPPGVYTYPATEIAEGLLCGEGDASSTTYKALNSAWVRGSWPLPNVWLGVSVEDQHAADERIPLLLQAPAAVRFLSCEPLLGPVDLEAIQIPHEREGLRFSALRRHHDDRYGSSDTVLDWIIVGGESGPGALPCDIMWVKAIVDACGEAGVACFVKQLGADPRMGDMPLRSQQIDGRVVVDRKGAEPLEWPEPVRVRQFPEVSP